MKTADLTVLNVTGLHARPAKTFVNTAKQFKSKIQVEHGGRKANAKSLISMLALGVENGGQIHLVTDGEDEEEALQTLIDAVNSGLGEDNHLEKGTGAGQPESKPTLSPLPPLTPPPALPANVIQAIPAAPGIAIGPAYRLQRNAIVVEETFAGATQEATRLQEAMDLARGQLRKLRAGMAEDAASEAAIFDVHLEILDDPDLLDPVLARIAQEENAAKAWQSTIEGRAKIMAQLNDPLLAARAADIHDVGYRVLRMLVGADESEALGLPDHPVVILAQDLSPSETASLDRDRVLGFCTAVGGPTAHAAIIARALALPAAVSAGERILALANGTTVILDGTTGQLTVEPDAATLADAQARLRRFEEGRSAAQDAAKDPAITLDGYRMEVVANVGGVADAEAGLRAGAEGVGLLRTEFLFLERTQAPTEDEQYAVYRAISHAMGGQPVIVRTLDIGGDKPLPYLDLPQEDNPFLGERGIRLCLNRPEILRTQLRAILRAASDGPLRIMFPMVADLSEWRAARQMVREIQAELGAPKVDLGIMIEIPSAALMADAFAKEVDFFSIGTNDLTQYTLAMDRMHPALAGKSDGLHPAVLRLIARTVEAAHANGKWVGICGELGGDPQAVPILLGLGVNELSVSVPAIPTVKAQLRGLNQAEAAILAQKALACGTAQEVRALT